MISAKVVKRGRPFKSSDMQKAVKDELKNQAEDMKLRFEIVTRTWAKKPMFSIDLQRSPQSASVGTDNKIFKFVDEGTKPHIIAARNAPRLAFYAKGFQPKSRPNIQAAYNGRKADKNFRQPAYVFHTGNLPRNWSKDIQARGQKQFKIQLTARLKKITQDLATKGK